MISYRGYDYGDFKKSFWDRHKVKYLKEIGQLNRQREFANDDSYTVQNKIEAEQKEAKYQQQQSRQEINDIVDADINSLSGMEFEKVCKQLVENMGFETKTTKTSGDGGIDFGYFFFVENAFEDKNLLMNNYLDQVKRHVKDGYAVIIIDDSDIAKPASRKLEALSEIKDGSGINNGRRRHPQEPE